MSRIVIQFLLIFTRISFFFVMTVVRENFQDKKIKCGYAIGGGWDSQT